MSTDNKINIELKRILNSGTPFGDELTKAMKTGPVGIFIENGKITGYGTGDNK